MIDVDRLLNEYGDTVTIDALGKASFAVDAFAAKCGQWDPAVPALRAIATQLSVLAGKTVEGARS